MRTTLNLIYDSVKRCKWAGPKTLQRDNCTVGVAIVENDRVSSALLEGSCIRRFGCDLLIKLNGRSGTLHLAEFGLGAAVQKHGDRPRVAIDFRYRTSQRVNYFLRCEGECQKLHAPSKQDRSHKGLHHELPSVERNFPLSNDDERTGTSPLFLLRQQFRLRSQIVQGSSTANLAFVVFMAIGS